MDDAVVERLSHPRMPGSASANAAAADLGDAPALSHEDYKKWLRRFRASLMLAVWLQSHG